MSDQNTRDAVQVAADIVEEYATTGVVSTDLYTEGNLSGLDVDALMEQAEDLYALSESGIEEFEDAIGSH